MSFIAELKRRNVVRVGVAYVLLSWVLLQGADFFLDLAGAPDWVMRTLFILVGIGLPFVLTFSWVFEITPEGIKRETDIDRSNPLAAQTGRRIDRLILVFLVLAVFGLLAERWLGNESPGVQETAAIEAVPETATANANTPTTSSPPATESLEPSIAVLPFADMSVDGDQGYFSDGIAEELLNLLVKVDGLKVASRTSSFAFKNTGQSISDIAQELKVDHVLEGSVRKAGDQVRITAQLIDSSSDRHLWSETYDRELNDIFAIQDEIASSIVAALQEELGVLENATIEVTQRTDNLDAYQLFLEARALFNARDRLTDSMALYEQAVVLDPDFSEAWDGLSAVYSIAPSWRIRDRDYRALAVAAAERALELNPGLSTAWAVKAQDLLNREGDHIGGMAAFAEAIANDAGNTNALLWRSIQWFTLGFTDLAIDDANQCLARDPAYLNCTRFLARYKLESGQMEEALRLLQKTSEAGFFGSDYAFLLPLIESGERLAAAMLLWNFNADDRSYPASLILDALEFPEQDHSAKRTQFNAWLAARGHNPTDFLAELVVLGDYKNVAEIVNNETFSNDWFWEDMALGFRKSPYFKPLLVRLEFDRFWRHHGFPPQCRPVGADDFECDP